MNARDDLKYRITRHCSAETAEAMLDAYRVDVLTEAEVEIALATERNRAEHPDEEAMVTRRLGMRAAERVVRGMREETEQEPTASVQAPDFFQPGHTYTHIDDGTDWKFRVDTVTTHPEDGERTALGWRHFRGQWEAMAYDEDDYEIHLCVGLVDVTEGGESR